MISAAAIVAAFLFGTTPIMAHAGGYECTCEHKCTEDHVNEECELCKTNPDLCCGDENEDPVTEEPSEEPKEEIEEKNGPLTPDGNIVHIYVERGLAGIGYQNYNVEKTQAEEWMKKLEAWKKEHGDK